MFVVDFMRFSDSPEIHIVCPAKQLETLVDEDVVHQEIGSAIYGDANTHPKFWICPARHRAEIDERHAGNGENQEEEIVFFKKTIIVRLVVVPMKNPQQSVHDVLVGEPCNALHEYGCEKNDEDGLQNHESYF